MPLVRALTLLSLFLYLPGIFWPALLVHRLGRSHESSVVDGCLTLFRKDELFLGLIVTLSALVLPPIKLAVLLWLGSEAGPPERRQRVAWWLERAGWFGCLEVYLIAILLSMVRLGAILDFHCGPGLYLFALSVLLGLGASACLAARSCTKECSHEFANR